MTVIVALPDAHTHFAELLDQAVTGEEVIFVRNGVPVVKLVPFPSRQASRGPSFRKRRPHQSGREDPSTPQVQ